MIALDEVQRQLKDRSIVRTIDTVPKGHIRIMTGLLYPDGASVDVFIVNDTPVLPANLKPAQPLRLSDLGQSIAWLLDVGVRPWLSKKRQAFVEDVLRLYGVQQAGGGSCSSTCSRARISRSASCGSLKHVSGWQTSSSPDVHHCRVPSAMTWRKCSQTRSSRSRWGPSSWDGRDTPFASTIW